MRPDSAAIARVEIVVEMDDSRGVHLQHGLGTVRISGQHVDSATGEC